MDTSLAQFAGPRLVQREEAVGSVNLFHTCFGGSPTESDEEIQKSYVIPRRGGTYAIFHEGQPVSQIGIFHDQLKIYDGTIHTGSIGGCAPIPITGARAWRTG